MINFFKKKYREIIRRVKAMRWAWFNVEEALPIFASSNVGGLKVHLGSGPINIQGWINVDARAYKHVHVVSDGFELGEFADGGISEIYLCHVLEHFSFEDAQLLLSKLLKKLCKGGVIRISVPSFDRLIDVYKQAGNDLEKVKFAMMGGQDYQYNFHKSLYNADALSALLVQCGYSNISEWDTLTDFGVELGDWSTGSIALKQGAFPISLNLKAVK